MLFEAPNTHGLGYAFEILELFALAITETKALENPQEATRSELKEALEDWQYCMPDGRTCQPNEEEEESSEESEDENSD